MAVKKIDDSICFFHAACCCISIIDFGPLLVGQNFSPFIIVPTITIREYILDQIDERCGGADVGSGDFAGVVVTRSAKCVIPVSLSFSLDNRAVDNVVDTGGKSVD